METPLSPADGDWTEAQLRTVAHAARQSLLRHPSLVELRVRGGAAAETLRFGEAVLSILRGAGFEIDEAVAAFRLLFTYTVGFAALSPEDSTESDRAAARAAIGSLPPDEFPALTEARDAASAAMGGEEVFAYGLDRIIDGLAARAV